MARKSGFVRRGGVMRRETLWLGIAATDTALGAATTAAIINSAPAGVLALRPFTIVRTRGLLNVRSDQISADETFGAALGFSVVSDQALAIGVTAVPTPVTDQGSDMFFVYEEVLGKFSFITGVGFQSGGADQCRYYDSKAMRKVNDNQDISFAIESQSVVSSGQVLHSGRMLVKLH